MPVFRNEEYRNSVCVSATIVDTTAGTIAFEVNGVAGATRPMTADEVLRFTPPALVKTPDEKLAEARTVLEQITALPAPVLTADVVDLLDDLRGVL